MNPPRFVTPLSVSALCKILFKEELDGRLMVTWQDILHRVRAVLENKTAEAEDSGSGDHSSVPA